MSLTHSMTYPDTAELLPLKSDSERRHSKRRENIFKLWAWAAAPLVGHFLFSVIMAIVMLYAIDRRTLNAFKRRPDAVQFDGTSTRSSYRLLQSDVMTIISFTQNLLRFVAGMWTGALSWRCTFILMEKTGVSLQNINLMTTYRLPGELKPRQGYSTVAVAIILLLAFPSQFSSPILLGSINWNPAENLVQGDQPATGISHPHDGIQWTNYRIYVADVTAVRAKALLLIPPGEVPRPERR